MLQSIRTALFLFILVCVCAFPQAQAVIFNEVVSSNSKLTDEDGDTPDWFELYNTTSKPISLSGWTITDDLEKPEKWVCPDLQLPANQYLQFWASGKNRNELSIPRTLINQGDLWRYIIPSQPVDPIWTHPIFNDLGWPMAQSGFGYGDGDDLTSVPIGTRSIFMRHSFHIEDIQAIRELIFHIDFDDAFVAYLNGVEIARANINGSPPNYNATSVIDHEAQIYQGGNPDMFVIQNFNQILVSGENVLSIQAHNFGSTSSDLTVIPFLSAYYKQGSNEGIAPPEILELPIQDPHTNFKLSGNGETLYLFDELGQIVDQLTFDEIPTDVSYGKRLNSDQYGFFATPTPKAANQGAVADGVIQSRVFFSHDGGTVDLNGSNSFALQLTGATSPEMIRYTLDATLPNENDEIYNGPIFIEANTVVRAKVFRTGFISPHIESRTYIIDVSHKLPIASLITEPNNLFDAEYGMYAYGNNASFDFPHFGANFWEDWERPIHFSLYEAGGQLAFNFDGGSKIFGGWSRGYDQRSFSVFARSEYGIKEIDFPIFPKNEYRKYQAFVLRNSGNDWLSTHIRDGVLTSLVSDQLETQAYRPTVTYINGSFWGIYNLREKINEHFLASKSGVNAQEINLLELEGITVYGDGQEYQSLVQFVQANSLISDANYQVVADQIDIDNFIFYQLAQIYFGNTDWPGNNIKFWKPNGGKWRWILYDTDFAFGRWETFTFNHNTLNFALEPNGPFWPNPPWSTLMLRKLTENTNFRNKFVNQFADELNSRFLPIKVVNMVDSMANYIQPEINNHFDRWGGFPHWWTIGVVDMKNFGRFRPEVMKQQIRAQFSLPSFHELTIQNNNVAQGYVIVNSLTIAQENWKGDYFQNVPILVKAIPRPGFRFVRWTEGSISANNQIEVNMTKATKLVPIFESGSVDQPIVINEINYNAPEERDVGDWVEFYNPNLAAVDLSGYIFKDEDEEHTFTFPDNTAILGQDYLVLVKNDGKFKRWNPQLNNVIGNFDFGLASDTDLVRLYDSTHNLVDSVRYSSSAPWPETANGTGATIELFRPYLDNSKAKNWATLHTFGSPGFVNDTSTGTTHFEKNISELKHFPNPFFNEINISFQVQTQSNVRVTLYDVRGKRIKELFHDDLNPGAFHYQNDLAELNSGLYLLEFIENGALSTTIKWLKL